MENPFVWTELRRLSLNVAAAHVAMVAFLEQAMVPWSDDQVVEFERISAVEATALDEYRHFLENRCGRSLAPLRRLPSQGGRRP